jgi:hypothetical protein
MRGEDPYDIGLEALLDLYGPATELRTPVFSIPRNATSKAQKRVIDKYGVPEGSYPPWAISLFVIAFGWLPDVRSLILFWLLINVVALFAAALLLLRFLNQAGVIRAIVPVHVVSMLLCLLGFVPVYSAFVHSQFSIVVFDLILFAAVSSSDTAAGIALGVAMFKPSMALPFAIAPLIFRRWRAVLAMGVVGGSGALAFSLATGTTPWAALSGWLAVSRYYLAGMYSVQEIVNRFELRRVGPFISVATLGLIAVVAYWGERRMRPVVFAFLAAASCVWVYHGPYDFVMALPGLLLLTFAPVALAGGDAETEDAPGTPTGRAVRSIRGVPLQGWFAAACYIGLSLGISESVYHGDDGASRVLRWCARIVLIILIALLAIRLVETRRSGELAHR